MTKSDPLHAVRMISQRVRAPSYFCTTLTIKNLVSMIIHALMLQTSDLLAKITTTIPSVHGFHSALLNNISLIDLSHFLQVSYFLSSIDYLQYEPPSSIFPSQQKSCSPNWHLTPHVRRLYVCSSFPFVLLCGHKGRQGYLKPSCVDLCLLKSPLSDAW